MATIFISYSHSDRDLVDILAPQIRNVFGEGSCWYDTSIQGGADWWKQIQTEIHACQVFLYLISDKSVNSIYCIDELTFALKHHKPVLQVLLPTLEVEDMATLPEDVQSQLRSDQYVDLRDQLDNSKSYFRDLSRLWGALNGLVHMRRLALSTTERWLLHNQYEILQAVAPEHPEYGNGAFKRAREILL